MKFRPLNILIASMAVVSAAFGLSSCDSVDADDRYIELPAVEVTRGVLVMDFTGQRCTNCPIAHTAIEQLEEQYGDAFIAVSVHAGVQSLPITNTRLNGLATDLGEVYNQQMGVSTHGYPSIVVDYGSTVYQGTGAEWVSAVRRDLAYPTPVAIDCEARHTVSAEGVSQIQIDCRMLADRNIDGNLQLWIVEDDIVAAQMGNDWAGYNRDYVHNNVLRAAANGDWGQPVALESNVYSTASTTYTISGEWEESWNVDHLKIVAFVYTAADGVLQVVRVPVSGATSEVE